MIERRADSRSIRFYITAAVGVWLLGFAPLQSRGQIEDLLLAARTKRAAAAKQMIVLAVEQGLAALPPTAGQSNIYEFDADLDTFVPSRRLGPSAFRSPETLGRHKISLQMTGAFFELPQRTFGPIDYRVHGPVTTPYESAATRYALRTKATVGLMNFGVTAGLLPNLDVLFDLPLVITKAHAQEIFLADPALPGSNLALYEDEAFAPDHCPQHQPLGTCIIDDFLSSGDAILEHADFNQTRVRFPEETELGVGRIRIGGRLSTTLTNRVQIAFAPSILLPSPSEKQLAGSSSTAIVPRVLTVVNLAPWARYHLDLAYTYDFGEIELRHFSWASGFSLPFIVPSSAFDATVDFGATGEVFEQGIRWTPDQVSDGANTLTVLGDNELGTVMVGLVAGIRIDLVRGFTSSVGFTVPINDAGYRPDYMVSFSVEGKFPTELTSMAPDGTNLR